ncbi:hypothetical protein A2454_03115 [Candidatus Peribacteria bacterium RIFOXYC2_FULL_55_14]|nr:MAG: hypothetical protein UY87_C0009G0003 [Candidatus Peribacteria bacterium GW2011_GWC2_54_8]KKW43125.1 MAG: hypothetical protein UY90_C0030G0008 [Candidatus Peregrinibacteria bacterium GW2011_GWA2_54_9]OGJ71161.1 MAG: hypothetical protein A2198_01495 [Candidatus Peribacteria bacterium RIFOXYA1_FULL_56_14]OGJ73796.1 MAG: hypothetical protein A2384_04440 [Candidatus Peribacteria bacterium RIFOXYB1_FULL_54_35]OGJ74924.1 MAG: hypothetical protein A2217_02910 [Candidatus Peribacteria bacterium 
MHLTAYQIIAPLVSFVAIVYAWNLVFKQKKTVWEAILWTAFWSAIAYIAIEPDSITYLTMVTGIKNRENAVLVTFLGILFFIVFYLVIRLEELEQRQTRLIRKIALQKKGLSVEEEDDKR